MRFTVITLFPQMLEPFFNESILKRAQEKGIITIDLINLRDFAIDKHGTVDDRPYGGGAGMVIRVDVVYRAIQSLKTSNLKNKQVKRKIVLTSAKGKRFDQKKAKEYATLDQLVLICGHYEGIDERVREFVDEEVSIGDFVLTGGELAAAVIVDSVSRLVPGVLGKDESAKEESFSEYDIDEVIEAVGENKLLLKLKEKGVKKVRLLEYPQYTRPEEYLGLRVPQVLLSGDHKKIRMWRLKKAFEETVKLRPDIFNKL